ncbi:DsbA family protein, partial [Candidatus Woesearchaeota archaeon]|nr:DsbA family protein [Candidatus Woesearchaeota archaeon]
ACGDSPDCNSDADCAAVEGKIARCENPGEENAECVYEEPVAVEFIVLNDKTCAACDSTRIVGISKQLFPGAQLREVDVSSAEGKRMVEELGILYVPAYLFDENVVDTNSWKTNPNLKGSFEKVGDYYKILDSASGASHFVDEEMRQKLLEEMGIELGDNRPQIDFFVMSYCPYGNQAEEAIEPVFQLLKDEADFNPYFVIYENYGGGGPSYCLDKESLLCSMHGIQELHQGIREHCVNNHIGTAEMFEFMLAMNAECSASNADTCWEAVAEDLGLDVDVITQCEDDEGLEITQEDKKMTELFGVSGSPTVFIDGEKYAGSRTAAGFQAALCAAFDDAPAACDEIIEGGTQVAATTGQC